MVRLNLLVYSSSNDIFLKPLIEGQLAVSPFLDLVLVLGVVLTSDSN